MPRSRLAMVRSLLVAGAVGTLAVVDGSGSGRVREALQRRQEERVAEAAAAGEPGKQHPFVPEALVRTNLRP